jgi:hypothetical protein
MSKGALNAKIKAMCENGFDPKTLDKEKKWA